MRFFYKKSVILTVALLTVFLLANSAARGKYHFDVSEHLVTVMLAPMEYVVSQAGYGIRHVSQATDQILNVYRDNQQLRAENEQLRQDTLSATEVVAENNRLRTMLDYKKSAAQFDLIAALVVARDPGSWTNVLVINRGTDQGISKDMPVVTPRGLVGNVIQVFGNTAKVQLILDPRSAVGCLVQRTESRTAAIVEGNGATPLAPRMVNLARDADIIKGDKVVTSGFGGVYPKGLFVGEVIDVVNEEGGLLKYAVLKPAADFDRLEEVFVLARSRDPAATLPSLVDSQVPTVKGAGQ